MVELREILESEEMDGVVRAVEALRQRFSAKASPPDQRWPIATALTGPYEPHSVLRILLANDEIYPGYRDVLAASFAGWLVAPDYKPLREDLVIQAALLHLDRAEFMAGIGQGGPLTIQKDIAARYIFTSPEFLIEIYDPLGGYQAFSRAASDEHLWLGLNAISKIINTVVLAIRILHHAVDQFGRGFTPSLNKAVTVLDELKRSAGVSIYKERYVARSLLHDHWSKHKQTLALIYAASTIRVHRKTLLQAILDGLFSFEEHGPYIDRWVSRARYVTSHIFARMVDQQLESANSSVLGDGRADRFAPVKLDESEDASFTKKMNS